MASYVNIGRTLGSSTHITCLVDALKQHKETNIPIRAYVPSGIEMAKSVFTKAFPRAGTTISYALQKPRQSTCVCQVRCREKEASTGGGLLQSLAFFITATWVAFNRGIKWKMSKSNMSCLHYLRFKKQNLSGEFSEIFTRHIFKVTHYALPA